MCEPGAVRVSSAGLGAALSSHLVPPQESAVFQEPVDASEMAKIRNPHIRITRNTESKAQGGGALLGLQRQEEKLLDY